MGLSRASIVTSAFLSLILGHSGAAQNAPENAEETFASENAILDTAIPFAIGAREARQSLRGAFGWPTFQEGLVEGVYFRFDPDGYARFAPTPRLDSDVFEVICRARTYSCMGRKGQFSIMLNNRNQMQLKITDVARGDVFFIAEGINEIQIPDRILLPLDFQMETLLATGSELIVRRETNEIARISLKGFSAVSAYLRWVTARQDYSVLPRGWPVPNSKDGRAESLTHSTEWISPMPQPQILGPGYAPVAAVSPVQEDVAEVRGELNLLRQLILQSNAPQPVQRSEQPVMPPPALDSRITDLEQMARDIRRQISDLRGPAQDELVTQPNWADFEVSEQTQPLAAAGKPAELAPNSTENEASRTARRLEYLMNELGMDLGTAVAVLQMNAGTGPGAGPTTAQQVSLQQDPLSSDPVLPSSPLYQDDVVEQILRELENETAGIISGETRVIPEEYRLLSQYFKSVWSN